MHQNRSRAPGVAALAALPALLLAACSPPDAAELRPDPAITAALTGTAAPPTLAPSDLVSFRALPSYSEPEWVTRTQVATGKLPPLEDRLPREPLVYGAASLPDGPGRYGGALRQVTGGRPEGWNYNAGQQQG